eukprot:6184774-Pleurochrysis_carterae.AAC.1
MRDLTDDMAQPLIKVSSRTFVALRPKSTQRTAGYAEAEKKKKRYEQIAHRVPKASARGDCRRRRQSSWNLWRQELSEQGRQAKMRTEACDCGGLASELDRVADERG